MTPLTSTRAAGASADSTPAAKPAAQRAHDLIVAASAVLDTPGPNNHDLAYAARYIAREYLNTLSLLEAETHAREAIQQRHENYANWHQRTCGCTPRPPGDTTHAPAGPP